MASFELRVDPEADAAYLQLAAVIAPASVDETVSVEVRNGLINIDLAADGTVLGIEFVHAASLLGGIASDGD